MGSYWEDKGNYERRKREEETNQAILRFILAVVGGILTFILSKLLAPVVSKYPVASLIVFSAIGIGFYFYFANDKGSSKGTKVEIFEDFANNFSQDENFCKQRISKIVEAEGYKKSLTSRLNFPQRKSWLQSLAMNHKTTQVMMLRMNCVMENSQMFRTINMYINY
ncbi:MAG: hypothetical protein J6Y37_11405 [Paludibacteraceae bacterium]|nr:hypothetical protein [Paludibacteraceae bacterium]